MHLSKKILNEREQDMGTFKNIFPKKRIFIYASIFFIFIMLFLANSAAANNVYDNMMSNQPNLTDNPSVDEGQLLADSQTEKSNTTFLFAQAMFKLVIATFVVILIVYFGIKIIGGRRLGNHSGANIQTLAVHVLSQNKTLQLIRIENKVYAIGVGEDIRLLKEMSDYESQKIIDDFAADVDADFTGNIVNKFDSVFKNKIDDYKKRNVSPRKLYEDDEDGHL